jgi:hypothetical protein
LWRLAAMLQTHRFRVRTFTFDAAAAQNPENYGDADPDQ